MMGGRLGKPVGEWGDIDVPKGVDRACEGAGCETVGPWCWKPAFAWKLEVPGTAV
jgi:hypothetical protein